MQPKISCDDVNSAPHSLMINDSRRLCLQVSTRVLSLASAPSGRTYYTSSKYCRGSWLKTVNQQTRSSISSLLVYFRTPHSSLECTRGSKLIMHGACSFRFAIVVAMTEDRTRRHPSSSSSQPLSMMVEEESCSVTVLDAGYFRH